MYCPNPECPNLLAHGIPAEYRDGVAECSECGHELEYGDPPAAPIEIESGLESGPVGWATVSVYDSGQAARVDKGLLEAEGIEALVTNEHFAAIDRLPSTVTGGVELAVPDTEIERALALIRSVSTPVPELLPDDEYEPYDPYREPAEARDARRPWQLLAVLLFFAGALLMFQGGNEVETALRETFYDRAAVSTFVVIHLPRRSDHLEKSEIDLILELDLEYIDTLDLAGTSELLELDLNDAVVFVLERAHERGWARCGAAEVRGVLGLRNSYLRRNPA